MSRATRRIVLGGSRLARSKLSINLDYTRHRVHECLILAFAEKQGRPAGSLTLLYSLGVDNIEEAQEGQIDHLRSFGKNLF